MELAILDRESVTVNQVGAALLCQYLSYEGGWDRAGGQPSELLHLLMPDAAPKCYRRWLEA
jgi:hypothetical protein